MCAEGVSLRALCPFFNRTVLRVSLPFSHLFEPIVSLFFFFFEKDLGRSWRSVKAQCGVIVAFAEEMHRCMGI